MSQGTSRRRARARSGTARLAGHRARPPVRRWTEERVRQELRGFLAGRTEWPSYRDFQRAGHKGLRDAVTRFGGARRWAAELDLPYLERPPGYAPIWTDERIRADLARFLEGRREWPPRTEFEGAGRKTLRDAIGRSGGPPRWAAEFGLSRRDERRGSRRVWTEERIEAELRELLAGGKQWPSSGEFRRAGKSALLAAVYAHGGAARWCRRLGVRRPLRKGPNRPQVWTEERIGAELGELCRARGDWPRFQEFEAIGKGDLYRAASRHGGVERWKRRLGVS